MNILIVGNGFDLAHQLKTKYSDFINIIDSRGKQSQLVDPSDCSTKPKLFMPTVELYEKVKKSDIFKYMKSQLMQNMGWIDFENELRTIVDSVCEFPVLLTKRSKEYRGNYIPMYVFDGNLDDIPPFMHRYLSHHTGHTTWTNRQLVQLNQEINNQISDFVDLFKEYIHWINEEKINTAKHIKFFDSLDIDHLVSFNYTSTYLTLYNSDNHIPFENICYVHGKTGADFDDGIVMGIGSDFFEDGKHEEFLRCFKFYQRYKYQTSDVYQKWLKDYRDPTPLDYINLYKQESDTNSLSNHGDVDNRISYQLLPEFNNRIYIYGHSLDPTDKNILLPFFKFAKEHHNTHIYIYYQNDTSLFALEKNLVRILGKDMFNDYLTGVDPIVQFKLVDC